MQSLRKDTLEILARVEQASGKEVKFFRDEELKVLSTMQTARNGAPFHILRYRPSNDPLDYFIAYQAGFLLRLFENAPDQRFDFAPLERGRVAVKDMLAASAPNPDDATIEAFSEVVERWALMQLRSLPIGMRIDRWLAAEYPALRDLQAKGLAIQQQQNAAILSQRVGALSVPPHLLTPCAAYALLTDQILETEQYVIPFRAAGVLDEGVELMLLWQEVDSSPEHDCELVDSWAKKLHMRDWYKWTPFVP